MFELLEIMNDLQLDDYYRVLNPGKKIYLHGEKTAFKANLSRLYLVSNSLSNIVKKMILNQVTDLTILLSF